MHTHRTSLPSIALVLVIGVAAAAAAQPPAGRGGGRGAGRGQEPPEVRRNRGMAGAAAVAGRRNRGGIRHDRRRGHRAAGTPRPGHPERHRRRRIAYRDDRRRGPLRVQWRRRRPLHAQRLEDRACRRHLRSDTARTSGDAHPAHRRTAVRRQPSAAARQRDHRHRCRRYGEPTPGTQVRVMRYVVQAGRRTLQQAGNGATDDRGIYRVYGLQPGEYIVSAVPRNVGPGVEVGRLQAELAQVREQVAGAVADAAAARELATRATMLQSQMPPQEEQSTGYPPCTFLARSAPRRPAPSRSTWARNAPASIFSSSVSLGAHRRHRGQLHRAGDRQRADHADHTSAPMAGAVSMAARADSEGRFHLANVPPGSYRLIARAAVAQAVRRPGRRSPADAPRGRSARSRRRFASGAASTYRSTGGI